MEPLSKLALLLDPASLALIFTAIFVVFASAKRAFRCEREMEKVQEFSESTITLDSSHALMLPIASSCSLLLMFYLFASLSQFLTAFTAIGSVFSLVFWLSPYAFYINSRLGFDDPVIVQRCCRPFTRLQGILVLVSLALVIAWLLSGHWILNNLLGIAICISFVSHVRLPNIKVCSLLLVCLFVYDIFWVFFSERFFGANVMVSVAMQQASNPVHTVVNRLNLPGVQSITKKLELPVKLIFPKSLLGGIVPGAMMLGLGDMAIPGMLLALVHCFDHCKNRSVGNVADGCYSKARNYRWYALVGYAAGLVAAYVAGVLTRSPQPALLYLVPSTLGPVIVSSWLRNELSELWDGPRPVINDKIRMLEIV